MVIRKLVSPDSNRIILTLSPIYAINAGLSVYSEFTTGPFAWIVSHLIPPDEARKQNLPLKSDIDTFISNNNPGAILTGQEKVQDVPLIDAAKRFEYQPEILPSGNTLWLAPNKQQ